MSAAPSAESSETSRRRRAQAVVARAAPTAEKSVVGMHVTYTADVTVDTVTTVVVDVLVIKLEMGERMLPNRRPNGVSLMLFLGKISSAWALSIIISA